MDQPDGADAFRRGRDDALALVEAAIGFLRSKRDERFSQAVLDPTRIEAVAAAASATGFSKETGDFPLPLFRSIELVDTVLEPFTLRLNEVERGAYTTPRMADPVSNEATWWGETMRERAAFVVLDGVLRKSPTDEIGVASALEFWSQLRERAAAVAAARAVPILLVQSEFRPRWLYDWFADRVSPDTPPRPQDLRMTRQQNPSPAYLFHMNGIAVYRAPVGAKVCYLLPDTLFDRIQFTRYPSGLPVDVRWEDNKDQPLKGTLAATFCRHVSAGDGQVCRMRLA